MKCPRCHGEMIPWRGPSGNEDLTWVCVYCRDYSNPLEQRFLDVWGSRPVPTRQYQPVQGRRWRVDFAWPDQKVIVECEGFDHRREAGFHRDVEKYNRLTADGWRIFRCTARLLRDDPDGFCRLVEQALKGEEGK